MFLLPALTTDHNQNQDLIILKIRNLLLTNLHLCSFFVVRHILTNTSRLNHSAGRVATVQTSRWFHNFLSNFLWKRTVIKFLSLLFAQSFSSVVHLICDQVHMLPSRRSVHTNLHADDSHHRVPSSLHVHAAPWHREEKGRRTTNGTN